MKKMSKKCQLVPIFKVGQVNENVELSYVYKYF